MADNGKSPAPIDDDTAVDRVTRLVTGLVAEMHPGQPVSGPLLDKSLERELGLDSLTRMELIHRVEREFAVALSDRVIAESDTARDLLRALASSERAPNVGGGEVRVAVEVAAGVTAQADAAPANAAPVDALTLMEVMAWYAERQPDQPHIRFYEEDGDGEVITFAGLWSGAAKIAAGLLDLDLEPGEAVLIMLPTGAEYFLCFAGVLLAGGVPVPMYPPGRPAQIEEHLRRHAKIGANALAGIMITVPEAKAFSQLMAAQVDTMRSVVTPEDLSGAAELETWIPRDTRDTAFLQYTSGSTGDPKGVVLSHANLLANIRSMGRALDVRPGDVMVSWLPLYHDMGLIGAWLGSLNFGMPLILMSPLTFLARPERWLKAIHRYRGTISGGPNFAYDACVSRVDDATLAALDLSSWRIAFNGAEAVSPKTIDAFCEKFGPSGFRRESMMPVYGLAENCVGLVFTPIDRGPKYDTVDRDILMTSGRAHPAAADSPTATLFPGCGYPIPGHQIRVVDPSGRELPDRIQGRIEFLGPSATSGYFRNPEATAEMFDGDWRDSKDLGYTVDGELFITGRAKDMIIRGGRNIFPVELEEAIGAIDGIQQGNVAVFGSTDRETGTERLVVMAEARRRDPAAQEKIRTAINGIAVNVIGLPPDVVSLVPPRSVPKTSSGKIRRQSAKQLFETGRAGASALSVRRQLLRLALAGIWPTVRQFSRRIGHWLFGVYTWILLVIIATAAWLLVAAIPGERWAWSVGRNALDLIRLLAGICVNLEGAENLPPDRAAILIVNHSSYLDGVALVTGLRGRFSFVAKGELLGHFVPRIFLRRMGTVFVERFSYERSVADADAVARAVQQGRSLIYFPEGTFSRMPGLLPFHMGAFTAAVAAGAAIVPVAIRGTRQMLRDQTALLRPGEVRLIVGPAIEPPPAGHDTDAWGAAVGLRDQARAALLRLTGEPDLSHERVIPETAPKLASDGQATAGGGPT